MNQPRVETFVHTSLWLLKTAHCITEENNSKKIGLSEEFVEYWDLIQDLWSLSMQGGQALITASA